MEKYDRAEIVEEDMPIPFPEEIIGKDFAKIEVKAGSRIFNLVSFAQSSLKKDVSLVISSCGPAITKAVTIAEIIKRKQEKIYQWNKIGFKEIKEFWDPNEVGMTRLRVTREIPTMHIYLTTTALDESLPGVQASDKRDRRSRPNYTKKVNANVPSQESAARRVTKDLRDQKRSRRKSGPKPVSMETDDGGSTTKEQ